LPPTGRGRSWAPDVGDSEDETFWRGFLTDLKSRGLSGVRLVIYDQHAGLVKALRWPFQGTGHRRVHLASNLLAQESAAGRSDPTSDRPLPRALWVR
jgi:transposase-like protein